ncbi:FtsX-like permease family protein [Pseudoflavitalea sp. X16]|uniref:ABC transporter permease n=1 Tax=Paraflavitalea devenefica TaxID=2716334 RepID=UPI00141DB8B0|nr:ABC transporter permease [Paraflavitalea devenefica]NII26082.1 FtsX-like permease family protein [Paraflavitalea devenefica]
MFKNHFKTAIRNLVRSKSYAVMNITGLAVGLAACLLIFLLIQFETSFDNFHNHPDRIYRVVAATNTPDGIDYSTHNAFPVAAGLRADYPQLEQVARIYTEDDALVTVMNDKTQATQKKFKVTHLFFADPAFFDIFNFPFIAGNPKTALTAPNTVVLTQQTAEQYFGSWQAAINGYIKYDNGKVCKVTGILKNTPANTDYPLQVVLSFKTVQNDASSDWVSQTSNLNTFVVLPQNMTAQQFDNQLAAFVKKHTPAEYANQGYKLQPLSDIHYDSRFGTFSGKTFSKEVITTLSLIGLFLVIIACINFINLATAQAVKRSKEVGIRKVLGSSQKQLILQFLYETFLITCTAVVMATGIVCITLPLLDTLLQADLEIRFDLPLIAFILVAIIMTTLLSGFYPAIILSGFKPITALKNKLTGRRTGGLSMRRALVVFQFAIAQALIIGTLVVVSQMNFFTNTAMGFDKEAIITVPIPNRSKIDALKTQLLAQAGIKNVSVSAYSPADDSNWGSDFRFDNAIKPTDFEADLKWADADYFKTYNIQFIAGRPYEQSDTVKGFVVNELLARKLGFRDPEDMLGKRINFWDKVEAPVVGVIKDFNGHSLENAIKPTVLGSLKRSYQLINIKIQPQNATQTLASIENLWRQAYPDFIYEYQFLNDKIAGFYQQERQLSQLYTLFAGIALLISCLGLYGLVSFMAVQRIKEVGVRKVLGASAMNIIYLFSKEFTVLVALAFLIAAPFAYYFMHQWLQNFAYRINISAGIFLLTIFASVIIAWLTVGYQSIKAALANPVDSLRRE